MGDLISRQAAIDAVHAEFDDCLVWDESGQHTADEVERILTAEPPHIKGRWIRKESDLSWWYECSECGESPLFDPYEHEVRTPFCPWCGAELRGDEE